MRAQWPGGSIVTMPSPTKSEIDAQGPHGLSFQFLSQTRSPITHAASRRSGQDRCREPSPASRSGSGFLGDPAAQYFFEEVVAVGHRRVPDRIAGTVAGLDTANLGIVAGLMEEGDRKPFGPVLAPRRIDHPMERQTDISRLRHPVRGRGKLRRPCSPYRAMDETNKQHRATGLYGQRRSRCSDAARELHIERTWMLAPIERIRLALSLGRRLQRLRSDPEPAGTRG